ncbi:hypothetical protein U1Q18_012516 [Sarracenia purpurea var. burkii]
MEFFQGNNTSAIKPQSEESVLGFASSVSLTNINHSTLDSNGFTDETLSQKFEKFGLGSNDDENENVHGNHDDLGGELLPIRPYAEDCAYYLRTGTCKFGLNCRFSHPVRRTNQKADIEKEIDKSKTKEWLLGKSEQIECKYYLTAEGCKYGKSCRYNHSKDDLEITPPELNFLGLPIRSGEKECPFYLRNGSCGYGTRCKFHHPDPTDVGGYGPRNSTPNDESLGYGFPPKNYNGESIQLHVSGASQPGQASWSTHMLSDISIPYQDNNSSYMPTMHFVPPEALQSPEWTGYQIPDFAEGRARHHLSTPAANTLTKNADISSQVEEFPERPGQPDCDFFVRTGDCKFKSACWYHHPKNQAPKSDCVLSDKGLPLRPGRKICRYYEQFGICKFGRACLFDHPVDHKSP